MAIANVRHDWLTYIPYLVLSPPPLVPLLLLADWWVPALDPPPQPTVASEHNAKVRLAFPPVKAQGKKHGGNGGVLGGPGALQKWR